MNDNNQNPVADTPVVPMQDDTVAAVPDTQGTVPPAPMASEPPVTEVPTMSATGDTTVAPVEPMAGATTDTTKVGQ